MLFKTFQTERHAAGSSLSSSPGLTVLVVSKQKQKTINSNNKDCLKSANNTRKNKWGLSIRAGKYKYIEKTNFGQSSHIPDYCDTK